MFIRLVKQMKSKALSLYACTPLDIKTDGSLKVNRRTLVITSCEASSNSKENNKEDGQASSHPITVQKANDLEAETGLTKLLKTLEDAEDFQHGPTNVKLLKCYSP